MAVKVVSDRPIRTKKVICSNCGYELEYTGEDVKSYTKTDYGGGTDEYHHITCPRIICGETTNVDRW